MNFNPNVPHGSDWQSLANYKFNVATEGRRLDKKKIAYELGIKVDTLQRHLNGTIRNEADFVRDFTRAVLAHYPDEVEFVSFFLPPGFRVIREDQVNGPTAPDLAEQQLELSRLVGRVQELIKEARADGAIDRNEHRRISRKTKLLAQAATELDERIKREVGP